MPIIRKRPMPPNPQAYFRANELAARWRVNVSTIWRWSKRGRLPKPTKLGPSVAAWPASAVAAFEARLEARP